MWKKFSSKYTLRKHQNKCNFFTNQQPSDSTFLTDSAIPTDSTIHTDSTILTDSTTPTDSTISTIPTESTKTNQQIQIARKLNQFKCK